MSNEGTIILADGNAQSINITPKIKELDIIADNDIYISTDQSKNKEWLTNLTDFTKVIRLPAYTPFHIGKFYSEAYEAKNNQEVLDSILIRRVNAVTTNASFIGVSW